MEENLARRLETDAARAVIKFLSLFDFGANDDIHIFYSLCVHPSTTFYPMHARVSQNFGHQN